MTGSHMRTSGNAQIGSDFVALKRQLTKLAGKVDALVGSPATLRSHDASLAKDASYGSLGYQVKEIER